MKDGIPVLRYDISPRRSILSVYSRPVGETEWTKIRDIHNIENNAVVIVDIVEGLAGTEDEALLYYQRSYMKPGDKLQ